MARKLKLHTDDIKMIYLLAPIILACWTIVYLYATSSSLIPQNAYDYEQELHVKESILWQNLIKANTPNADPIQLSGIYRQLSSNEICLKDLVAAQKHLEIAQRYIEDVHIANRNNQAYIYLQTANLYRDLNKLSAAKVNYEESINRIYQIPLNPDFNERVLYTVATDFNNLGILYFLNAQKAIGAEQQQKYYLLARDYFVQAKHLMWLLTPGTLNKTRQCFYQNIDENLNQCLAEMQFLP